jgi:ATP-dependent exoDNAse (exonuclease V) alpha subunit
MRHEVPVDLLVLDESSMLSSEHGDIVVRCNALRKTSLLLVGDDMQLLPVGSGEIFRPLLRQARLPCLLKNLRARDSLQEPLLAIRGGQASRASAFAATAANETDRHARVFEEILASSGTCQVLALRNEDRVNYCSFAIKKQHAAVEDDFSMGKPHPVAFKPYVGEPVRFQKNTCKPQACRGMLGVVTSVAEDASVPEASERGPFKKIYDVEVLVAPDAPPVKLRGTPLALGFELRPAFAITVHDSQGGEFDHVHVLMPPSPSSPLCTLEMLYTAASRARCTLKFWCVARPFQAYEEAFAKVSDARVTPLKATLRSLREA